MNNISPKKLKNSKWTSLKVTKRRRHFLVSEVDYDDEGKVIYCEIEAIIDQQKFVIDWRELTDNTHWRIGWQ